MRLWQLVAKNALKMNSAAPTNDKLPDGAIKIKIEKVMLTADDALIYLGAVPIKYPFVPGCHAMGRISETAKDVADYKRGTRVVMRSAEYDENEGVIFFGRNKAGFMRDFITVSRDDFYVLPSSVTDEESLFMGIIARAEAVVDRLAPKRGDIVAVMGGSYLAIIICQTLLASKIIPIYIDHSDERRALARKNGVFYTLDPGDDLLSGVNEITGGRLCNGGVYSFTGNVSPVNDLFRVIGFNSTVVFTGDSSRPVNMSSYDITRKDITLRGVYSGYGHELSAINRIINKGINLTNYRRNASPDSLLPEAYERISNPTSGGYAFEIITF